MGTVFSLVWTPPPPLGHWTPHLVFEVLRSDSSHWFLPSLWSTTRLNVLCHRLPCRGRFVLEYPGKSQVESTCALTDQGAMAQSMQTRTLVCQVYDGLATHPGVLWEERPSSSHFSSVLQTVSTCTAKTPSLYTNIPSLARMRAQHGVWICHCGSAKSNQWPRSFTRTLSLTVKDHGDMSTRWWRQSAWLSLLPTRTLADIWLQASLPQNKFRQHRFRVSKGWWMTIYLFTFSGANSTNMSLSYHSSIPVVSS